MITDEIISSLLFSYLWCDIARGKASAPSGQYKVELFLIAPIHKCLLRNKKKKSHQPRFPNKQNTIHSTEFVLSFFLTTNHTCTVKLYVLISKKWDMLSHLSRKWNAWVEAQVKKKKLHTPSCYWYSKCFYKCIWFGCTEKRLVTYLQGVQHRYWG